jgi:hypothetical protein
MTENKFDMAVITAVDGEGCLACSWDERDLESEEIDLEDGEKIPAMLYEKEVVFNLITAVLSDMVKRDEGLFLSVVENLKEKKNIDIYKEKEKLWKEISAINYKDPKYFVVDENFSPYHVVDVILGKRKKVEKENLPDDAPGLYDIIPSDSPYKDAILCAAVALTDIVMTADDSFSVNSEAFNENGEVAEGFAIEFAYKDKTPHFRFHNAETNYKCFYAPMDEFK